MHTKPDIIIKNAEPEDFGALSALHWKSSTGASKILGRIIGTSPEDEIDKMKDYFNYCTRNKNCILRMAEIDGKPAGFTVSLVKFSPRVTEGYIESLYVDPDYQGLGVGKALIKDALSQLKKMDCDSFSLHHDAEDTWLREWYARQGFKTTNQIGGFRGSHIPEFFELKLGI